MSNSLSRLRLTIILMEICKIVIVGLLKVKVYILGCLQDYNRIIVSAKLVNTYFLNFSNAIYINLNDIYTST